jgi:preprotein translocase subunit YajC
MSGLNETMSTLPSFSLLDALLAIVMAAVPVFFLFRRLQEKKHQKQTVKTNLRKRNL